MEREGEDRVVSRGKLLPTLPEKMCTGVSAAAARAYPKKGALHPLLHTPAVQVR